MRIAFVSGNREQLPDAVIPLGLLYVIEACPNEHEKVLWDLCFEPDPSAALERQLQEFQPDVVALGMRNVQNNGYEGTADAVAYYRSLIATIRAHSQATIVVGGGGFSVMPEELMTELRPDYGVAGEGEGAFPKLLSALSAGPDEAQTIPGVYALKGDELSATPRVGPFLDVARLPVPDRRRVDPRYYERYGIESVQTKRGCSLSCEYCTYPTIEGRQVRYRKPELVVDELLDLVRLHGETKHVFIVDSVFNIPPAHAKAVCHEMLRRGWSIPWTCYANPVGFDAELAELMARAGCTGLEIGSDSGCDDVLVDLKKGFDVAAVRQMHDVTVAAGIKDCHTFMLGTPSETIEHVRRTLDFIDDLQPFSAIIMTWVDDHEAVDPDLAPRRQELRAGIAELLEEALLTHPRWIVPALGINFDRKLFAMLRRMGLSGPLWQHVDLAERRQARFAGLRRPSPS